MRRLLSGFFSRRKADRLIVAGNRAEAEGKALEACERYRQALGAHPGYARAHLNLGVALEAMGDADAATRAYRAALVAEPGNTFANYNLGKLLYTRGEHAASLSHLQAAVQRKPDFTDARLVLASVLEARDDVEAAVVELEAVLARRPDYAGAWYNYALALKKLQRLPDAEAALRRTLALDASLSGAYRLLAGILVDQLRVDEALQICAAGRKFDAKGTIDVCELFVLNFHDGISTQALFERHKSFGERFERAHAPRFLSFANRPDPERPLRIGYLTGDFRAHPVGWGFLPLVDHHDRATCQAYCYSLSDYADAVTRHVAMRADRWHELAAAPPAEVADLIHHDAIDVLVDLSGYGGIPTFEVMTCRPAPVQASWLGYLSTSGLRRIDYRISDAYADPPALADRFHTEKLARLPHSQWCYRPPLISPAGAEPLPAPPRERNGCVTFGSFNQSAKLSATARRLWAGILRRTPGSRLLIVGVPPGPATQALLEEFERHGVARGAVSVEPRLPAADYFLRLREVDVALDTTPYSGGTTTCDTLWMGTPVITLSGERSVSRSAASILAVLGLDAWIATSPEDYVARAVELARGGGTRESGPALRERMRASPLMDEAGFARDMEALYRQMWRTWCAASSRL